LRERNGRGSHYQVRAQFDGVAERLRLRGPELTRGNTYFALGYFDEIVGLEVFVDPGFSSRAKVGCDSRACE